LSEKKKKRVRNEYTKRRPEGRSDGEIGGIGGERRGEGGEERWEGERGVGEGGNKKGKVRRER